MELQSIQISGEVYQSLIDYLASCNDSKANHCLEQLTKNSVQIKKCCRCVEPATEKTDNGNFYCYRHWVQATTEDDPLKYF